MKRLIMLAAVIMACGTEPYEPGTSGAVGVRGGQEGPDYHDAWVACCVEGVTCDETWAEQYHLPPGSDPNCDEACANGGHFNRNTWGCM